MNKITELLYRRFSELDERTILAILGLWADIILSMHSKQEPMYSHIKSDLEAAKRNETVNHPTAQWYTNRAFQKVIDSDHFIKPNADDDIARRLSQIISYIRRGRDDGFIDSGLIFWTALNRQIDYNIIK